VSDQDEQREAERQKFESKAGLLYVVGWACLTFGIGGTLGLSGLVIGFGIGLMVLVFAYTLCDAICRSRPRDYTTS
jgi:uncharacterized membrane protein YhdT